MTRLLQVSLLLNVVLLGLVWLRPHPEAPMPRMPRGEFSQRAVGKRGVRTIAVTPKTNASTTPWVAIESADTRLFIANLRALGCPEGTIRDLVVSRVCREYRSRLLHLQADAARSWDITKGRSQKEARESHHQQRRLRDQMNDELEDLLGQPAGRLATAALGWPDATEPPYLSLEKRRQVRDIERRFDEQTVELQLRGHLGLDSEDSARLKELEQQREAEIAALLTPQELEERLYRTSAAARYVRQHLPQARSEAEFRDMVRLAAEFDLANVPASVEFRYGIPGGETDGETADYERRKAAFDQRLKETLGEQRIAEQQAEEQAWQARERQIETERNEQEVREMAESLAAEVGIPAAEVNRFMDRMINEQATLSARLAELEKTLAGTPEERQRQMQEAVEAELEQMAVEAMGEKGRDFVQKLKEFEGRRY